MLIYPAIDLRGGQVVRLSQGDYSRMTVYSNAPEEIARGFAAAGAACLHIVDLDGAKAGGPMNRDVIARLSKQPLFVQVGGGMRTEEDVESALALGVGRVILGTAAVTSLALVERLAKRYGGKIAVGVDARNGLVATHGWLQTSGEQGVAFCQRLADIGVSTVIYTDIAKDGQLAGTNLAVYEELSRIAGLAVIASGGVSFEHEIVTLRELGIHGAILGKALYTGKLDLRRAVLIARGELAEC
ncbi:MAG: 1-(5-phosphoribosyl)-5-[(5-phosphoribosylamino)methylideneamino]imidazole-4-carboxamide isomerase [Clostridia bacterium]